MSSSHQRCIIQGGICCLVWTMLGTGLAGGQFAGGTGEPNDPYQIATAADLVLLGESPGDYSKYFILTADIDLAPNLPGGRVFDRAIIAPDTVPETWWDSEGTPFSGVFDGNGHTISHLTIKGGGYLGLFGELASRAEVRDLGVVDVNITSSGDYVGGLVGYNGGSVWSSCSTGSVNGIACVGGLVGVNNSGSVLNSYSTGSVSGTGDFIGGLVGKNYEGTVSQCYSAGSIGGTSWYVGGLVGYSEYGHVWKSFWDVTASGRNISRGGKGLTTAEMQDPNTFLAAGWDFLGEWANGLCEIWLMSAGRGYPELSVLNGYVPLLLNGSGTLDDPYVVDTAEALGTVWYRPTACYRLASDVDLSGMVWSMAVVPAFSGRFDGQGHRIRNMTVSGGGYLGLFGSLVRGAVVSGLGLEGVSVAGTGEYVGALAGENWGSVSNCCSAGSVSGTRGVGGLVGSSVLGTVVNSCSEGSVSGIHNVGGLVGDNGGSVSNDYSTGSVRSTYEVVGGLVGSNWGSISSSYSTGSVSGIHGVGGLVGLNAGSVSNSFWDVTTSGRDTSAGGTGLNTAQMQDPNTFLAAGWDFLGERGNGVCEIWLIPAGRGYPELSVFNGYVPPLLNGSGTADDPYVVKTPEGLGTVWYRPTACYRLASDVDLSGMVSSMAVVPTFAGRFDGQGHRIWNMTVSGGGYLGLVGSLAQGAIVSSLGIEDVNVVGTGYYVGGLVGYNQGFISCCYSTGTVSGTGYYVGGLVGDNGSGSLWSSCSAGSVSGIACVGGLVGGNGGSVLGSHSTGSVNGIGDDGGLVAVGGLVGVNEGSASSSYSTGSVTGMGAEVGGLAGCNYGTVTQCYSTGSVGGMGYCVGGLVGDNEVANVADCYNTGAVSGRQVVGGLVGYNNQGCIANSYVAGTVRGGEYCGGLVGDQAEGSVRDSFWDTQISGQATSAGGTGKTTAEMQRAVTFLDGGWDFVGETINDTDDIWMICEGKDYPRLKWEGRTCSE